MTRQTGRVLVVEDTVSNLKMLEAKLLRAQLQVRTACSGGAALALFAEQLFDIVLLDVMMPGMDGFEVCRRIKAAAGATPVILITALDSPEDRARGLAAGADDFFVKPVADPVLFGRVYELMAEKAKDTLAPTA